MAKRKTLKQRIALDGGKEIEEAFGKIGRSGKKAFAGLEKSAKGFEGPAKRLSDAIKRLRGDMRRLRASVKRVGDGFRNLARRGRALRAGLGRVGRRLGIMTAAALAAAAGLFKLAQSGAAAADSAGKTAQGVGLTVTELGRLVFAAEQSGISQEKFLNILTRFNQGLGELAEEERKAGKATKTTGDLTDRAREAFEEFGVTVRDMSKELAATAKGLIDVDAKGTLAARALKGAGITALDATGNIKPLVGQILEFSDAFARVPDGVEKVKSLIDITGTRNARLAAPFFNQTAAGLRKLGDEGERLNLIFSPEEFKLGVETVDALNRAVVSLVGGGVLKGLTDEIGLIFSPELTNAADAFTAALRRNRDAIVEFVKGPIERAISLAQDILAALFGDDEDVREPFILEARDAVLAFARDVGAAFDKIILPAFRALLEVFDLVAKGVNAVFGTDFSGRQLAIASAVGAVLGVFTLLGTALAFVAAGLFTLVKLGALVKLVIAAIAGVSGVVAAALLSIGALPALLVAAVAAAVVAIVVFWDEIAAGATAAFDFIAAEAGALADRLGGAFAALPGIVSDLMNAIGDAFAILPRLWDAVLDAIAEAASGIVSRIVSPFERAIDRIAALLRRLRNLAAAAAQAVAEALGFSAGGGASSAVPLLSGGGKVRGPGTPTSDSIPAWLSDTEFVIQAKAVRHYGASIFAALNAMRLPKIELGGAGGGLVAGAGARRARLELAPLRGYGAGGAVQALDFSFAGLAPVRAHAHGGPIAASALPAPAGGRPGTPITLILDGQSFETRADQEVAEALGRWALRDSRSRIGTAPRRAA